MLVDEKLKDYDFTNPILRWLHLSDFHVGKDDYGQRQLFRYILEHVKSRIEAGLQPDIIFLTGDIANKGQVSEYESFMENFLFPLKEHLGEVSHTRIYMIPGNHDVDRTKARLVQTYSIMPAMSNFFDPNAAGFALRTELFERFKAFSDHHDFINKNQWLFSEDAVFTDNISIQNYKVGILGFSSAWFSCSDNDQNQLYFGKALVETGLQRIQNADIRIVLGHHPIEWLHPNESHTIRALFGKYGVIYLHGHLHRNFSRFEYGAGYPFLALQAGASFQAREHDVWVNRILWGELHLSTKELHIEPLHWAKDNQEWSIEGGAFPERFRRPGTDRWIFPIPSNSDFITEPKNTVLPKVDLPQGWLLVDRNFIEKRRVEKQLTEEQIITFFDGRIPRWQEALSPYIPRRAIVHTIREKLERIQPDQQISVTVLLGPGGEGKSTVLLQTVCDLLLANPEWRVLWHHDEAALQFQTLLPILSQSEKVLVTSDDADLIGKHIFDIVKQLNQAGYHNVHFLLACRDTDWLELQANQWDWKSHSNFQEEHLRGLTDDDAQLIVKAWWHYNSRGLGQLEGLNEADAAKRLAKEAKSESYSQEGAFLGAMLRVRIGDNLENHVRKLLIRLQERSAPGGTLMDAFAYIAVPHAENILSLSKAVLAKVLQCEIRNIRRKVTGPLGEEAVSASAGNYILTRHRAIAEASVKILSEEFFIDTSEILADLVRAAVNIRASGDFVIDLPKWRYLASDIFANGKVELSIRLAQAAVEGDPENSYLVANLGRILREAGLTDQAVEVFRSLPMMGINKNRAFYYEWATTEGNVGNTTLDVWLAGFSISDQAANRPPDNENATIALAGMTIALTELFRKSNKNKFLEACGLAAKLGLSLRPNPTTSNILNKGKQLSQSAGIKQFDLEMAFTTLTQYINATWELDKPDSFLIGTLSSALTFHGLARLLGI